MYQDQAKGIDPNEIEWNGKYKRIRELRDISVLGMALYDLYSNCGGVFCIQEWQVVARSSHNSLDYYLCPQSLRQCEFFVTIALLLVCG